MKAHVITGSKQDIVAGVTKISGEIKEAIVFVEEPPEQTGPPGAGDLFAGMEQYMVNVPNIDDSREAIYRPMEGE
jgi:hypothetical protein